MEHPIRQFRIIPTAIWFLAGYFIGASCKIQEYVTLNPNYGIINHGFTLFNKFIVTNKIEGYLHYFVIIIVLITLVIIFILLWWSIKILSRHIKRVISKSPDKFRSRIALEFRNILSEALSGFIQPIKNLDLNRENDRSTINKESAKHQNVPEKKSVSRNVYSIDSNFENKFKTAAEKIAPMESQEVPDNCSIIKVINFYQIRQKEEEICKHIDNLIKYYELFKKLKIENILGY